MSRPIMRPTPKVKAVDQKSHKLLAVPDATTKAEVVPPVVDSAKPYRKTF